MTRKRKKQSYIRRCGTCIHYHGPKNEKWGWCTHPLVQSQRTKHQKHCSHYRKRR